MTWEIIAAAISLIVAALGVYKWWLKSKQSGVDEKVFNGILQHQKDVRLSIKDAERVAKKWCGYKESIAAGTMPSDKLNRVRSGKRPDSGSV